ncbi:MULTISPECIES: Flp family type IVb pilin [unclassified Xanthobacter]|uniref:Flp family type IVb pilin n=1 Tax=unclassified Xanthobacter TaxID=2623496 RepID=UPI001F22C4FA|nr:MULTISPECIES: hypothetical protein [unclassified Xanthobacter]
MLSAICALGDGCRSVWSDNRGAGAMEYGGLLVVGIVAATLISTNMGTQISTIFSTLTTKVAAIK